MPPWNGGRPGTGGQARSRTSSRSRRMAPSRPVLSPAATTISWIGSAATNECRSRRTLGESPAARGSAVSDFSRPLESRNSGRGSRANAANTVVGSTPAAASATRQPEGVNQWEPIQGCRPGGSGAAPDAATDVAVDDEGVDEGLPSMRGDQVSVMRLPDTPERYVAAGAPAVRATAAAARDGPWPISAAVRWPQSSA